MEQRFRQRKDYVGKLIPRSTLCNRRKKLKSQENESTNEPHDLGPVDGQLDQWSAGSPQASFEPEPPAPSNGVSEDDHQMPPVHSTNMTDDDEMFSSPAICSTSDGSNHEASGKKRKVRRKRRGDKVSSSESDISIDSDSSSVASNLDESNNDLSDEEVLLNETTTNVHCEEMLQECFEEHEVFSAEGSSESDPLCPCSDVTVNDLYARVLALGLRHGLTWKAQVDILKLVASIFKNSKIPASQHFYWKKLLIQKQSEKDATRHIYCQSCESYLGPKQKDEADKFCDVCQKQVSASKESNFFISLSVESQMRRFLGDGQFLEKVKANQSKRNREDSVYSDITDGSVYKTLIADGVMSSPFTFSYTFFTDGVAFGKSSRKSIWPIYITINELPYESRMKYIILAGLYVGTHPGQYFLEPFVTQANKLSGEGFMFKFNGEYKICKTMQNSSFVTYYNISSEFWSSLWL